jgi:opacity protein-like surface antigen
VHGIPAIRKVEVLWRAAVRSRYGAWIRAHKRKNFVSLEEKMAKKGLFVLVLAAFAAGGLWAQQEQEQKPQTTFGISAGIGGLIGGDFGGGVETSQSGNSSKSEWPYFGGGGYAFFDATYAELTLAFLGGGGKIKDSGTGVETTEENWSITNFNIGLLGKYPFAISDKLSLFPLLGIDYHICLSAKNKDGKDFKDADGNSRTGDFSAFWFKFGGGGDFALTKKIYLRLEALYGIRLANKDETDLKDEYKKRGVDAKTLLGHGLEVKLAAGYKF